MLPNVEIERVCTRIGPVVSFFFSRPVIGLREPFDLELSMPSYFIEETNRRIYNCRADIISADLCTKKVD